VPPEAVIGWDIGGAHLKAARLDAAGRVERVVQLPCALWRGLAELDAALDSAVPLVGEARLHGVTMTGEMVDFFPTRRAGVACLVGEMQRRFGGAELRFYAGRAGFLDADAAIAAADRVASANWMASAELVAARVPDALLVDIGSTTTDLVVVREGRVRAAGRNDAARLVTGELVYTGVARTPVMAMAPEVPFEGKMVPLMAEHFATAADVHRLTGRLPPGADLHPAADGGEKTEAASARRLARMIGRDAESAPAEAWQAMARWLAGRQLERIERAARRLLLRERVPVGAPVVAAGVGRFLAADLASALERQGVDFAALLPEGGGAEASQVSDCAAAVAVAWLAHARLA
jgi:probable H4MPT-linked C1 transfer pathway protein